MIRPSLRPPVDAYLARHPAERHSLAPLLATLEADAGSTSTARTALLGHLTCGAVIVDRHRRVLHMSRQDDKADGKARTPRGRVGTGDRTLVAAAVRAACEETGLRPQDLCLTGQFLDTPVDIGIHAVDADQSEGEPARQRYDVRFVFCLRAEEPPLPASRDAEVAEATWLPLHDVASPTLRAKLLGEEARGLDGRPEPVNASVLIHDGYGRYLLHLRDNIEGIADPGVFGLPGGGREQGDRCLEATLRRELAEEAPGLGVADLTPFAVVDATGGEGLATSVQVFTGRWSGDPDSVDLQEGVLIRWFTPDMLDRLRLSPGVHGLVHRHAATHPPTVTPAADPAPATARRAPEGTEPHIVGVHLYLQDERGRVLLGLRHPDSAYAGETWHLPAGHCERESAVACLVREAQEETGLVIEPADVELAHVVHLIDDRGAMPRVQLVFRAHRWGGSPELREPDKCVAWKFWAPDALPEPIVPYARAAIEGIRAGRHYTEMGWDDDQSSACAPGAPDAVEVPR
ncbi:NUDIX domain-containing protein [Streptomyces sp. NPDC004111]|uniref:NUDIX hydrolase n=1 Tax=Streptomyces sp. NPDC004111 TaxID=3364690 RepID=UPI0036BA0665